MKVTSVEKKEKSTVELTIQVEADVFEAAIQRAYLKNRAKINVPGFRRGKAPRKIIEGMYGAGVFYEDAIEATYPAAYADAVKEQGLDDVGYPHVELVEAGREGYTFKALVAVRPEVKLGKYKGLTAPKAEVAVTDADVDAEMKPYIDRATRLVSVEREAQKGDTVVIDFEGFDNGAAFEGGRGENYDLKLGSGSFVPGFEEQLVGLKAGGEKELNITFPEDYHADLAGKAVVFHVKVKEVKESQVPEVDDEFAKDVSEFETLEAFRADLKEKVSQRRQAQAKSDFDNQIMERLIANMECEVPDGMVDVEVDRMMEDYAMQLQNQGISMADYQKMMGVSGEMIRSSARPDALRRIQTRLALEAVAAAEKLEIAEDEVDAEIARLAEQYKLEAEQVKAAVSAEDLKKDLVLKKASELVLSAAKAGGAPKAEKTRAKAGEAPKTEKTRAKAGEAAKAEKAPAKPKRARKKKAEEPVEQPKAEEPAEQPKAE